MSSNPTGTATIRPPVNAGKQGVSSFRLQLVGPQVRAYVPHREPLQWPPGLHRTHLSRCRGSSLRRRDRACSAVPSRSRRLTPRGSRPYVACRMSWIVTRWKVLSTSCALRTAGMNHPRRSSGCAWCTMPSPNTRASWSCPRTEAPAGLTETPGTAPPAPCRCSSCPPRRASRRRPRSLRS